MIPFSSIDVSDSSVMASYGHLLASAYRNLNGFVARQITPELREILDNAELWIQTVERNISSLKAREIQNYLQWYDLIHRMVFYKPADYRFINRWMEKVLIEMARGEKADEPGIMSWIKNQLRLHPETVSSAIREWYSSIKTRWVNDFLKNRKQAAYPVEDCIKIITFLLDEDLDSYLENSESEKKEMILPFMGMLNELEKGKKIGVPDEYLWTLAPFALSVLTYFPDLDIDKINETIDRQLSESLLLNRFSRQAYLLDLHYETA